MLFNSYIFIGLFLPAVLLGWYLLNNLRLYKPAKAFLAGMSLLFYAYFNVSYLLIIVVSVVANYLISLYLERPHRLNNKLVEFFGVVFNLGILFYYKYYNFFISNINALFKADFNLKHILLPLGISFFTFQQLSYTIDRCRGESKHYSFVDYLTFVTFFPQLVAGPIVMYDEMMPQFENVDNRRFNPEMFYKGLLLFSIGMGKKVLLADVMANVANFGFTNMVFMDSISTFLCGLAYAFELYFDFSGYSDMAIGLGRMFNIELPVNFNSPYKATSIKDLWNRWHITLSRFFVRYVYIPLGGSRKGKARTMINLFVIFALSGLWHGAAWTYVLWGVMQGAIMVWDNLYLIGVKGVDRKRDPKIGIPKIMGQFFTFNYFLATLFVFRSESIEAMVKAFSNLFSFRITGYLYKLVPNIEIPEIYMVKELLMIKAPQLENVFYLILFVLMLIICIFIITRKNAIEMVEEYSGKKGFFAFGVIILVWSVISFSQVSTFIYFNF